MASFQMLPVGEYCMYLRKSRADLEAEERGEGETLDRHRKQLYALSKRYGINITHVYQEIVSGDRIATRPEMIQLLQDVEEGRWKGVLVMEVERLARGDTMDQGLVAQSFKESETLIITPQKIYDPNNEADEEYFEFGLFMSRREYKTTKRRLQGGRRTSVKEGRYVGTRPPYGYKFNGLTGKKRLMEIDPDQAEVVKLIFDLYLNGTPQDRNMGSIKIAGYLTDHRIPTYRGGEEWNFNVVLQILNNEVYIGKIQWDKQHKVVTRSGTKYKKMPRDQWIHADGIHEPIIDEETFRKVQFKLKNQPNTPVAPGAPVNNPLAGILKCGLCGKTMLRYHFGYDRKTKSASLRCNTRLCVTRSSRLDYVEERLIEALKAWLKEAKIDMGKKTPTISGNQAFLDKAEKSINQELADLQGQREKLFDLLERGVYTEELFLERSKSIAERIEAGTAKLEQVKKEKVAAAVQETMKKDFIPTMQEVLRIYPKVKDAQKRNELLKSILLKVEYFKSGDDVKPKDFELRITPRFSQ